MKKRIILLLIMLFPLFVNATDKNTKSFVDSNIYTCTKAQDSSLNTNGDAYFTHCIEATCNNGKYNFSYYENKGVSCTNGNKDPYFKVIDNKACDSLKPNSCVTGTKTYCTTVVYYDCSRISSGKDYVKPTEKPTETKTKATNTAKKETKTKTQVPPTVKVVNTKLSSLEVSPGSITFNKEVFEYNIEVEYDIDFIRITAIPEDSESKISVNGNDNIVDGSVISVVVTGTDNTTSEYKITVKKKEKVLSSNASLKSLEIEKYELDFSPNVSNYELQISSEDTKLEYELETEDPNAITEVVGNNNLTNGSIVKFIVSAEDRVTSKTYSIKIIVKKKSNFLKVLFIITIVLAVIAGAYYIYKKFIEGRLNKGGDYEYE